jgi:septal ring factor EnvC (AmiA/AmiB activator)
MTTRKNDPQLIQVSIEEFAEAVRTNGKRKPDWMGWLRLALAAAIPFITVIVIFDSTRFQVAANTKSIEEHKALIQDVGKTIHTVKEDINTIEQAQAVILEKINQIQHTLDKEPR